MTVNGGDPFQPPTDSFSTGIVAAPLVPGYVPPFEEHEARIGAGYSLAAWRRLSMENRALEVAHLRLRHALHLHREAAIARQLKRKSKGR